MNEYISQNKERFLSELFELLRIPSISAISSHKEDMIRTAEWLAAALMQAGADKTEVMPTEGNPVVYGEKIVDKNLPTVVVYGHYDVMPIDPVEQWHTDPFEPVIKDGRIWGRGADDDKGQLYMHIKAFETMVATNTLTTNLKFMLEGEEETGSESLYKWCKENKQRMKGDVILVSDTSMIAWECPSITAGLRGICYMQVEVEGPDKDLHSGLFGGAVANPAYVLSEMISKLKDRNGHIAIPGFYDDVMELTESERNELNKAPFNPQAYMEGIGVSGLSGEEGYTTAERTGVRPALDVNGIWSGYTGEGTKTIIPSKASAKISMRLVPHQKDTKIAELFEAYFKSIAPEGVKVKAEFLHGGEPYVCPTDSKAYLAAAQAVEQTFGLRPLPFFSGGSIPIVSEFERTLGMKSVLLGFGLSRDAIHSPNESYGVENFLRGIETIVAFCQNFGRQDK